MLSAEDADETSPDRWFELLVQSEFDGLYLHVRLIYPLVNTEETLLEVFGRARQANCVPQIGVRAWLRRLARQVALEPGDELAARRNADAAVFGIRDTIDLIDTGELQDDLERLVEGLSRLSIAEQELLRLSSIEDLTATELACILDVDVQCLTVRLTCAHDRLRWACSTSIDDEDASGRR